MMTDDPRDELSPAERRAFAALPRELAPAADLEERTVALLRRAGHLPTPITAAGRPPATRAPAVAIRWWLTGAVAAALAVFASGLAVGQYLGARNAAMLMSASGQPSAAEVAARVQRAGSLYVAALASLSELPDTGDADARASAQRVALRVLGAAAEEMALLAPDDPLAAAVLRGLNQRSRESGPTAPSRSVVWY
jgi:hypothetical protein